MAKGIGSVELGGLVVAHFWSIRLRKKCNAPDCKVGSRNRPRRALVHIVDRVDGTRAINLCVGCYDCDRDGLMTQKVVDIFNAVHAKNDVPATV